MSQSASVHRTLMLDGSPEPIRGLRAALSSFLRDRHIDEQVGRAIVLAFSEALDNALEHGLTERTGMVVVKLRYTPRFILVSLRDSGSDRSPAGFLRSSGSSTLISKRAIRPRLSTEPSSRSMYPVRSICTPEPAS